MSCFWKKGCSATRHSEAWNCGSEPRRPETAYSQGLSKCGPWTPTEAPVLLGNLSAMHILRPHPRLTELEFLEMGPKTCLTSLRGIPMHILVWQLLVYSTLAPHKPRCINIWGFWNKMKITFSWSISSVKKALSCQNTDSGCVPTWCLEIEVISGRKAQYRALWATDGSNPGNRQRQVLRTLSFHHFIDLHSWKSALWIPRAS